jgi:hypothetical protein
MKKRNLLFCNIEPDDEELDNIKRISYWASFKGKTLGYFKEDTLSIQLRGIVKTIGADQISAAIAQAEFLGFDPMVTMTLLNTTPEFIASTLLDGAIEIIPGANGKHGYGIGDYEVPVKLMAGELDLYPVRNEPGDKSDSFRFHKAFCDPQENPLVFSGSKNNYQEITISMKCLPDKSQSKGRRYGIMGNVLAGNVAPLGVMFTADPYNLQSNATGIPAITIADDDQIQLHLVAGLGDVSETLFARVNNGAGSGTGQTVIYDNEQTPDSLAVGSIVAIGDSAAVAPSAPYELAYIKARTSTQFTLTRGVFGTQSMIVSHADNTKIKLVQNWMRIRVTGHSGTEYASSDPTKATIGEDPKAVGNADQMGRLAHVAAGSTDVVGSFNGIDSDTLTVTAA